MVMGAEAKLQAIILKWLRQHGCVALKYQQNATTHASVADIFFCKEGFYGFIEVKASKNAKRRPGQEQFISKMSEWSYGRVVWPENWPETRKELEEILR